MNEAMSELRDLIGRSDPAELAGDAVGLAALCLIVMAILTLPLLP